MNRIKGGKKVFLEKVNYGFKVNIHNPTLYYSKEEGFYIASSLIPNQDYKVCLIHYSAITGKRCLTSSDYNWVRRNILECVYGQDLSFTNIGENDE